MGQAFYKIARTAFKLPRFACVREFVLGLSRTDRKGPYILACTHISHLEPAFVGSLVRRPIRWMSRIEYYRSALAGTLLDWSGAFAVDRFGNATPAIRHAVRLIKNREIVGIFPEGGVATGQDSVLRGGPIKGGACTIAIATGIPIIPVVVLGTQHLNRIKPWLPTKSARVWIAFGNDIAPPPRAGSRRTLRLEMSNRLRAEFIRTYQDLLAKARISDDQVP